MNGSDIPGQPRPSGNDTFFTNVAQGADVTMQVSAMHGDAHFYNVKDDAPREKYRVGLNYLKGNAHRQAEKLIREAFMSGYSNTEVAYHWTLAILGGRSFDHLEKDDFEGLSTAFELLVGDGKDPWSKALAVVNRLVRCLAEQDSRGNPDPVEFGEVMSEFDQLPAQRREEIRRHLDMLLAGGIQDQFDARYASELAVHRMSGDRRDRAWKFFFSDPAPPVRREPREIAFDELTWFMLVPGVVFGGVAIMLILPPLAREALLYAIVAAPLCGAGGFLVVKHRWEQVRRKDRYRRIIAKQKPVPEDGDRPKWDHRGREHARLVMTTVHAAFGMFRPRREPDGTHWSRSVRGIRNAFHREILELYGPKARVDQVIWLACWYAGEIFKQWKSQSLPDHKAELKAPRHTVPLVALGSLALVAGACVAVAGAFPVDWSATVMAIPLFAIGGFLTYRGATMVYLELSRYGEERDRTAADHQRQYAAYEEFRRKLADRPDDSEMARWLDYDKAHVKQLAMRQYKLTNRDVLAHAVLTEAKQPCTRARVVSGPPRYSRYLIRVFLLTEGGVRQFAAELNFTTGMVGNEERTSFHYGAFASAMVTEVGMRLVRDQPQSADRSQPPRSRQDRANGKGDPADALVLSRTFQLSLVNDQEIKVRVENFDQGLIDRVRENPRSLLELALDVAGINGALRILESVAAEGKDWIERERRRRDRRLRTYQQGVRSVNALPFKPAA